MVTIGERLLTKRRLTVFGHIFSLIHITRLSVLKTVLINPVSLVYRLLSDSLNRLKFSLAVFERLLCDLRNRWGSPGKKIAKLWYPRWSGWDSWQWTKPMSDASSKASFTCHEIHNSTHVPSTKRCKSAYFCGAQSVAFFFTVFLERRKTLS